MNSRLQTAPITPRRRRAGKPKTGGFSLVELMVSITVGLILLSGMTALLIRQTRDRAELHKISQQIENGRYAMQVLQDAIEHAGFYGEYPKAGAAPAAMPDPCATTFGPDLGILAVHVQGYDSPSALPAALAPCLAAANHLAGTDILVIRRTDSAALTVAAADANQVYLQATMAPQTPPVTQAGAVIGSTGATPGIFNMLDKKGNPANLRAYHVEIYFISPCSVPGGAGSPATCTATDDGGRPIPTLKRLELTAGTGGPAFQIVPLVEGIENMQFDYGLDSDNDGAPDAYTTGTHSSGTVPMASADWANVMTIRANLLARSTEPSPDHRDAKTYMLNGPDTLGGQGAITPASTNFKRHVFTGTIRLHNPSGRREQ